MSDDRVADLERRVEELTRLLETKQDKQPLPSAEGPVSRRDALRTAGVLAAGAIAGGLGALASASPAAAAPPPVLTAGATATEAGLTATSAGSTFRPAIAVTATDAETAMTVTTNQNGVTVVSTGPGGVAIQGESQDSYGIGVQGTSDAAVGTGVRGVNTSTGYGGSFSGGLGLTAVGYSASAVGVRAKGAGAAIQLAKFDPGIPPMERGGFGGMAGFIDIDVNNDVWLCVTPGTWRKIGGPATGGAFHPITPVRAYDSRKVAYALNGVIAKTTTRTVSVADSHNTSTGALVTADVVPLGATAVAANVTVTGTTGTCYFCVNPGGTTSLGASTVNWFGSGQTLANGVILTLDANRQVTIVAGDSVNAASAHCIIDVTGYWL